MGMDVYGREPKSEAGVYFRANIWSWRPIHELIEQANVLPQNMVEDMSYNMGAGPNSEQALLLAAQLDAMLDGMNDEHEFMLSSEVDGPVAVLLAQMQSEGIELVSPRGPVYSADVSHVREFVEFCKNSGGFQVC